MSKIFDAYKKRLDDPQGDKPQSSPKREFSAPLFTSLFPPLEEIQKGEFDKLANRMLPVKVQGKGAVIGFAASASGEGTSFVSYHAAMVLAQTYDQRVAWVDANFLSPQDKLKSAGGHSLGDLLHDPSLVKSLEPESSPCLIPAGNNLLGRRGLFAGDNYPALLEALANIFDFVVMDFPAILKTTDTALMAAETDGLLLVVEQKYLKREVINYGVQGLIDKNVQVLGAVLNQRQFELPKALYNRL